MKCSLYSKPLSALILSAALMPSAMAEVKTWDGGAVLDDNWSSNLNWDPNGEPTAGDSLVFPTPIPLGDSATTNDLAADLQFLSLTMAGGYSVDGNRFRLSSGLTALPAGSAQAVIEVDVTFTASQTIRAQNGALLTFNSLSTIDAGTNDLTIDANHADSVIILAGPLTGSGQLIIGGPGEVAFTAGKSYTGPLQVLPDGRLRITSAGALGTNAGATTVNGALILDAAAGMNVTEALTLAGGSIETTTTAGSAAYTLSQTVSVTSGGGDLVPRNSRRLQISGQFSGTGPVAMSGGGVVTFSGSGSNTYSGLFSAGVGVTELNKLGGALALAGPVVVEGTAFNETAELRFLQPNQLLPTTAVTVNGDGNLNLNGQNQTLATLVMRPQSHVTTGAGMLTISSGLSVLPGNQGDSTISGLLRISQPAVSCHVDGGEVLSVAATVSGSSSSAFLRKTGDGILSFDGPSTLAKIELAAGTLVVNSNSSGMDVRLEGIAGQLRGTGTARDILAGLGGTIAPAVQGFHARQLSLNASSALKIQFSTSAGAQSNSLLVCSDRVALANAALLIDWAGSNFTGVPGDRYIILEKTDGEPVIGNFAGRPDGSTFSDSGRTFFLNYHGGDGDDVEITLLATPTGTVRTWSGAGANSLWSNPANWIGNQVPQPGDDLTFPAAAARKSNVNDLPVGFGLNRMRLESTNYNLSGAEIALSDGIIADYSGPGSSTVGIPLKLTKNQTISAAVGALTLSGTLSLNGARLTVFRALADKGLEISGPVSNSGFLLKTGAGTVILSGANTFTGQMEVLEGTVIPRVGQAFGAAGGPTIFQPGTTLLLESPAGVATSEPLEMNGGILTEGAANHTLSGQIFFPQAEVIIHLAGSGDLTFSGDLHQPNGGTASAILKLGPGTMVIAGAEDNQNEGTLTIGEGSVHFNKIAGHRAVGGAIQVGLGSGFPLLKWLADDQVLDETRITATHATVDLNGHTDTITTLVLEGGQVTTGNGVLSVLGDISCTADAASASISGKLHLAGQRTHLLVVPDGTATVDLTLGADISGDVNDKLRKADLGRVDFAGNNSLGEFILAEGESFFFGTSSSAITLDGGVLSGTGTVGSVVGLTSGIISPGASPGLLTSAGVSGNPGITFKMEINGRTPGVTHDQFASGTGVILSNSTLEMNLGGGFLPVIGDSFTIISAASGTASRLSFAGLPEGSTFTQGGFLFSITYQGGDGNDVVLTVEDFATAEITTISVDPGTGTQTGQNIISVQGIGTPGMKYSVEKSVDLQSWNEVEFDIADQSTGELTFTFTQPATLLKLFFRLRLQ